MLKLVFNIQDNILRVREAFPEDNFNQSYQWENKLEFIITKISDFSILWSSFLPDLASEYAEALVRLVSARYPVSPDFLTLKNLAPELTLKNNDQEWVFYGGTFHPWHQGHQACLDLLPENKLCLVLPDRNPQKELRESSPVSDLLKISTQARFKNHQFLVPTFLLDNKKNPSIEWIERVHQYLPQATLSLLLGFDSFASIKSWIRAKELLNHLSTLYVVSRLENEDERNEVKAELLGNYPHLNIIFLGKHPFENLSSTSLKRKQQET